MRPALRQLNNNKGWRLDYILVSKMLMECVTDANVLQTVGMSKKGALEGKLGSDHAPIFLRINLKCLGQIKI